MSTPPAVASPHVSRENPGAARLRRRMTNPWMLRLYMLAKLPLALMAGLRVRELDASRCVVTVPFGWRSTNPFRSTYFAALSMAAEMSTGAPALLAVRSAPASVAMLITGMTAEFGKKATATTWFTCEAGEEIAAAVARTVASGEPEAVTAITVGRTDEGAEVARFTFTWSFKRRG